MQTDNLGNLNLYLIEDGKAINSMKIIQKLLLGFLGTSLMVGVTGYVSLTTHEKIKNDAIQLSKSSIQEIEGATRMHTTLQAIKTITRELITQKYRGELEVEYADDVKEKMPKELENLKQKIEIFKSNLNFSKSATQDAYKFYNRTFVQEQEIKDAARVLAQIEAEFYIYKKYLTSFTFLLDTQTDEAQVFLEQKLEPQLVEKILPLIKEYRISAELETAAKVREIEETIVYSYQVISIVSGCALSISVFLGLIISNSISIPIVKFKQATAKIVEGKTETRVNVESNDEIGVLASDFNQMMDRLAKTTVSRSYFDNIINSLIDTIIVIDANKNIVKVNRSVSNILGYKESELIGTSIEKIFDDRSSNWLNIDDLMHQGFIEDVEKVFLAKDGSKIPVSFSCSVMRDEHSQIQGIVCAAQDISERKRSQENLQSSLSLLHSTLESTADGILVVDNKGKIQCYNQKFSDMWQIPDSLMASQDDKQVLSFVMDQLKEPEAFIKKVTQLNTQTDAQSYDLVMIKDGRVFERYSLPQKLAGQGIGRVWSFRDVTERKRAEEALRESEERYALAARGANDGLWDWNLKTNEVYFSTRWKAMLGCDEDKIGSTIEEWLNRVHPQDVEQVKTALSAHLHGQTPHFENEHRMLHQDGEYRWMLSRGLAVRNADDWPYRIAGSQTDITQRKVAEEQLLHDALHDALTGLPNRLLFINRLGSALKCAKRSEDYLFAVLFLDLDRFKLVNDSLGHLMGDQLLVAIARRLEACLRPGDIVARLGGDEFTILLENIKDVSDATRVAERIQKELALPFNLSGNEVFTSASIGIALSTTGYERPEDLLRDADTTMYRAKAQTTTVRYEVFDTTMHTQAMALLQLETDLRRAIQRQEFQIQYQPIVSLTTGRIISFEALVRWQHPEQGLISPAKFISMAEETGLIVPIGAWVLREACRQTRAWQEEFPSKPPVKISINLSSKQFSQPDLVEQIKQVLWETGLDARSLGLEITESAIMENAESAIGMLKQLRNLGLRLYIDDFGTGYSSLSYLHRFPIDTLKIDRSFVNNVDFDAEKIQIIRTIVALAWNLGMDVVAEGIETKKQMYQLKSLKCDFGQGYYFSRPVDGQVASALIAEQYERVPI